MNIIEISVFILFLTIISVPLAVRFRLPVEVFLVIGSSIISLLPGLPKIKIHPMIIFHLFLPPILFAAAYFTSWRDFKFNLRPISLLAFGLVIFTTVVVACIAKFIIPGFTWQEGFLLGAIVSPTDASAATTIIRKLNAPRRLIAVIEGESLLNDATALTLYRLSLFAIMLGTFSVTDAVMQFFTISLGGIVSGVAVGFASIYLIKRIKDVQAETTFTFITAYASYFIAEHIGFSGIIATVTTGIYFGIHFPEFAPTQTRLNAKTSWGIVIFIINGFVFTLLGLELPEVIKNLGSYSIADLIFYGVTVSIFIILVRVIWVFPAAYLPRLLVPSISRKDPVPPWEFLFIVGWSGMRGIVSLAAVLAIPNHLLSGEPFPYRDLIIFLTYCVIVVTLMVPTFTLPFLIRSLRVVEPIDKMKEEATARMQALDGAINSIKCLVDLENIPSAVCKEFIKQIERRRKVIQTQLEAVPYSSLSTEYLALKRLTIRAIESERETLLRLRKSGEIHDEVFRLLSDELDLEELRARSLRI